MVVFALRFLWIAVFLLMALTGCSRPSDRARENETTPRSTLKAVNRPNEGPSLQALQIPFVENQGQMDPAVSYYAPTLDGTILVTRDGELVLPLPDDKDAPGEPGVLRERLLDAKAPELRGSEPAPTRVSSYIGADARRWATDLPTFRWLSFGEIYDGVSLELRAFGKRIEKVFTISPGADPKRIAMTVSGSKAVSVSEDGELRIETAAGAIAYSAPKAYQEIDGKRRDVEVAYRVDGRRYGFTLGEYDNTHDLVIDPVLSTYLGGTLIDRGHALVSTLAGVYIAGERETDAFVAKLTSDLGTLQRLVYLGGAAADVARALLVLPDGDVIVTGRTESDDFPDGGAGGVAPGRGGGADAFAARLNGNLELSSALYIGGADDEGAQAIALRTNAGAAGDMVYIAGIVQPSGPAADVFIARFPPDLAGAETTTLGGRGADRGFAIAVHPASPYDVYVAGETSYDPSADLYTGDFPGIDPADFNGENDAFVARLSLDLTEIKAATYVGGRRIEFGLALGLHPTRNEVYLAGGTICSEDPHAGSGDWLDPGDGAQVDCGGDQDAFVARLDATDLTRLGASYLGGLLTDRAYALDFHPDDGSVCLYGNTRSSDLPGTDGAVQPTGGGYDLFLAKFSADLDVLRQSTYLGGTGLEEITGPGLSLSDDGSYAFVTGSTESSDFPGVDDQSAQTFPGGSVDAFVARVDAHLRAGTPGPNIEVSPLEHDFGEVVIFGSSPPLSIRIANQGEDPLHVGDLLFTPSTDEFALNERGGDGPSCDTRAFTLASGESCTVAVTYRPSDPGPDELLLRIESDSPRPEDNVHVILHGSGRDTSGPQTQGRWEIHEIEGAMKSVDVAVEEDGQVHLCYFTPFSPSSYEAALRYATGRPDQSENWEREDLDVFEVAQLQADDCEIVVASDGSVNVAYVAEGELRYRRRRGTTWEPVEIVSPESGFREVDRVDGNVGLGVFGTARADVQIVYRQFSAAVGAYVGEVAVPTEGGWQKYLLHGEPDLPADTDFARWNHFIDPTSRFTSNSIQGGRPVLAIGNLRDLCRAPATCVAMQDTVQNLGHTPRSNRFTAHDTAKVGLPPPSSGLPSPVVPFVKGTWLGPGNAVYLWTGALLDAPLEDELLFESEAAPARQVEFAAWPITVDAEAHLSLAFLDPSDRTNRIAAVAFYDAEKRDLKLWAKLPSEEPLSIDGPDDAAETIEPQYTEVVESAGDIGRSVEIVVDQSGVLHLAYLDITSGTVKYARQVPPGAALPTLSPSRWWFPHLDAGESELRPFVIANVGDEPLQILGADVDEDDFVVLENCDARGETLGGTTLGPGESWAVCVRYEPEHTTKEYGTLTVETSAGEVSAALLGAGGPADSDQDGISDEEEGGPCCMLPLPYCPDKDYWEEGDEHCFIAERVAGKECYEHLTEEECESCDPITDDWGCYEVFESYVECNDSDCACPFEVIESRYADGRVRDIRLGEQFRSCDSESVGSNSLASLWTYDRSHYVTIESHFAQGTSGVNTLLEDVRAVDPADYGLSPEEAPYGFFSFTLVDADTASTSGDYEAWIRLPELLTDGSDDAPGVDSYTKFGPTPDDPTPHRYTFWYQPEDLPDDPADPRYGYRVVGASYGLPNDVERGLGHTIVLRFREGRILDVGPEGANEYPGDHDLTNNGRIVDPGGPVVTTGEGGGCSCRVQEPRSIAGTGLLIGIVGFFLLWRRRSRA